MFKMQVPEIIICVAHFIGAGACVKLWIHILISIQSINSK